MSDKIEQDPTLAPADDASSVPTEPIPVTETPAAPATPGYAPDPYVAPAYAPVAPIRHDGVTISRHALLWIGGGLLALVLLASTFGLGVAVGHRTAGFGGGRAFGGPGMMQQYGRGGGFEGDGFRGQGRRGFGGRMMQRGFRGQYGTPNAVPGTPQSQVPTAPAQ